MRSGVKFLGLAAVAALSLTALAVQDSLILKHAAKVGDVAKYRLKSEMEAQGMPMTFNAVITDKITKVADNGDFTVESKMSEAKIDVGGNEMDISGQTGGPTTTVFKLSGEVISVTSDTSDPNAYRMANLQSMRLPTTALKVGDTWTVDIKKDDKGAVDAKGSYKIEARETIGGHDTFRIHESLKESIDKDPASAEGTVWIDVKDGSLVKMLGTMTNAPIPQMGPTTMKMTLTREG
jgi:hypothetical protein